MKLFKYNQFLGEKPLNENLDKAKKFLKDTYLLTSAANDLGFIEGELKAQLDHKEKRSLTLGDFTPEQQAEIRLKLRELKLKDEEVRTIERNPDFLKIRELLGQKYIGWTHPFTYFYFVEMLSLEELFTNEESLLNKLIVKSLNSIFVFFLFMLKLEVLILCLLCIHLQRVQPEELLLL